MDNDFLLKNFNKDRRRRYNSVSSTGQQRQGRSSPTNDNSSTSNQNKNELLPGNDEYFHDRNHTFHLLSIASLSSQHSRRSNKSTSGRSSARRSSRQRSHTSYHSESANTSSNHSSNAVSLESPPTYLNTNDSPVEGDQDKSHRRRRGSRRKSPARSRSRSSRPGTENYLYSSFNHLTGVLSLSTRQNASKQSSMLNNLGPIERFKRVVYIVQWFISISKKANQSKQKEDLAGLHSFTDIEKDLAQIQTNTSLAFDPRKYRASTESTLTNDVISILKIKSSKRTDEQIKKVVTALKTIETFAEYPLQMQWALCKHGCYQSYEAMRVIIRQGHYAENYYMILSGSVVVSSVSMNQSTKELQSQTLALLKRGACFGELALVHHSRRNATVTCRDNVSLLTLSREAFMNLFMGYKETGGEPDHIIFLRTIPSMQHIPLSLLSNNPGVCLFHYFRRGAVVVRDSSRSDWVYIVKSGYCEVLKRMRVKDSIPPRSRPLSELEEFWKYHSEYDIDRKNENNKFIPSLPPLAKSLYAFQRLASTTKTSPSLNVDSLLFSKGHRRPKTTPEIVLPRIEDGSYRIAAIQSDTEEWVYHDSKLPNLSELQQLHNEDVQEDLRVHEQQLEEVYKKLYKNKKGLENIIFDDVIGTSLITMAIMSFVEAKFLRSNSSIEVSNGAECIMISKEFLQEHLTNHAKEILRFETQPYPSEDALKQNFQAQTAWNDFKRKTVKHILKLHNLTLDQY
ncbi:uncharacterized protein TRIADDRAFT_57009 [Trichoplax adhaerens]|uniref:Cyclic nucleotide-binding domain-containing protein n=1 Tax=Trichoplax adhaerens TaxID=10228 RepID=B3RX62_TRIAD|nr:hypothetical protein TRIADDRAFT_57009 [Trichoplax adhaerens]EDV25251.1 hypothetical protein TRIADDRAFT_57009 [Trichoplax adhaerens]|eukprot:XP_002113141.1 hypothetical protein TRIADDRAFT_57009 [Trichoplax adhaerens]